MPRVHVNCRLLHMALHNGITSTGINLWRAILGFALAFLSRGLAAVYCAVF